MISAISSTMAASVCVVSAASGSSWSGSRDRKDWPVVRRRREGAKDVEREGWLGREDGRRVDWGRRGVGCWEDWRAREPEDEERFIASSLKGVFFAWEERGSSGLVVSKFGVWSLAWLRIVWELSHARVPPVPAPDRRLGSPIMHSHTCEDMNQERLFSPYCDYKVS